MQLFVLQENFLKSTHATETRHLRKNVMWLRKSLVVWCVFFEDYRFLCFFCVYNFTPKKYKFLWNEKKILEKMKIV